MYIKKTTSCQKGIRQAKDYRKENEKKKKEKANYKGENHQR